MKKILSLLGGVFIVVLSTISCTFAYTQEEREAYEWAYKYGITTQPNIEAAKLNGNITRQAFSKMVVNYLENVVGVKQTTSSSCYFPDENKITNDLKPYTKKSCSYNIMGSNGSNFNPTDTLTKAHLGTVLSRILRGDKHNSTGEGYYIYHVNALQDAGIMDNISNASKAPAKRGDVLVMLKRMYDKFGSNIYMNENQTSAYNQTKTANNTNGSVINYSNSLVDILDECNNAMVKFGEVFEDKNASTDSISKSLESAMNICEGAKAKVTEFGDFDGDSSLKDAFIMTLDATINFQKLIETSKPYWNDDNISENDKKYQEVFNNIEKKNLLIEKSFEYLGNIQESFAKKHGFVWDNSNNGNKNYDNTNNFNTSNDKYNSDKENVVSLTIGNIVYTGKDGTAYTYHTGFINLLIKTADQKGESDLVAFLEIESDFLKDGLEMANFDEEEFAEELGIDLDNLEGDNMTKKEKEELANKFGTWVKKLVTKNKDRNNKFIKDLEKVVNKVRKDDMFQLQEKYEKYKTYIEASNGFLDTYAEMITNLMKTSITAEEGDENEETIGQAFALIGITLAYQSSVESYQTYLNEWAINTVKLLGLNS